MAESSTLLNAKYRVGDLLGTGGMAVVHAGVNVRTDRQVAIKRPAPDRLHDEAFVARFLREAKAAGRVRSPHVVEVLDVDVDECGVPFIVMDRLYGETLASLLAREGALTPATALAVASQLLAGLAAAHGAGVIHRDIKPANVFLERREGGVVVKIVDFGISKITDASTPDVTRSGEALGTFSHMAPEQIRKTSTVGPPADLWSVGVILYRTLTGEPPFRGDDPLSLLAHVLERPAPPLASSPRLSPRVAAVMQGLVDRALEKDPALRFRAADEMAAEIAAAVDTLGEDAGPAHFALPPRLTLGPHPPRRVSALLLAAGVALGAAAGWSFAARSARAASPATCTTIDLATPGASATMGDSRVASGTCVDPARGRFVVSAPGFETREVVAPARPTRLVVALAAVLPVPDVSPPASLAAAAAPAPAPATGRPAAAPSRRRASGQRGARAPAVIRAAQY